MYNFGKRSAEERATLHPKLQQIVDAAIKHEDFSIIQGVRHVEEQEELFRQGKTTTMKSKHLPDKNGKSRAMDIMKYPIKWDDSARNYMFVGFIRGIAASLGIKIRVGADWDGDYTAKDQSFHDLPHIELADSEI